MELITFYFLVNFVSILPLVWAADKRTVNNIAACIVTLLFSPLIGFLFVLCYPLKDDVEYHERMIIKIDNILRKLSDE